jgi:hypothetical protein
LKQLIRTIFASVATLLRDVPSLGINVRKIENENSLRFPFGDSVLMRMKMKFKVGDTVRLFDNAEAMQIYEVLFGEEYVECLWTHEDLKRVKYFPVSSLQLVESNDPTNTERFDEPMNVVNHLTRLRNTIHSTYKIPLV